MRPKKTRHGGIQLQSKNGKLFLSFGGYIYTFHLAIYRFSIAIESKFEAK